MGLTEEFASTWVRRAPIGWVGCWWRTTFRTEAGAHHYEPVTIWRPTRKWATRTATRRTHRSIDRYVRQNTWETP